MTLSVKHKFTSPKADGTDSTLVKPSNWNDEHDITSDSDGIILGRAAGAGSGPIQPLPMGSMFPSGVMMPYAGPSSSIPAGWVAMYGQAVSRTGNPGLFTAIGTTYGAGDGATTFNVPDGRGVGFAGMSNMGGTDRGNLAGANVLGAYIGSGANRQPRIVGNITGYNNNVFDAHGAVDSNAPPDTFQTGPGGEHTVCAAFVANTLSVYARTGANVIGISGNIIDNGSALTYPFDVIQPTLCVNWIIKL